ncbi:hypothetical protein O6H91_13G056400 [Diphasiastrum complanatum]|uniref:Uncharacterized protein n=1 Tax=Diphasiastrum complanatum TaxID=34168 RepID=A0ACC2BUY4_DIPCM|nr:hypothetical protein O6H91_13G056400 [Diphasiastrum complanatum]
MKMMARQLWRHLMSSVSFHSGGGRRVSDRCARIKIPNNNPTQSSTALGGTAFASQNGLLRYIGGLHHCTDWVSSEWRISKHGRLFSTEKQLPLSQDLIGILKLRMTSIEARYDRLTKELSQPEARPEDIAKINRELSKLEFSFNHITRLRSKQKEIDNLKMLVVDETSEEEEIRQMAADELKVAIREEVELQYEILLQLLPRDDADDRGCIMEVRAGTGGEEASLFAMDIFKMYERYAHYNDWRFEVLGIAETDLRGYKEASASVSGTGVYGRLKFESGVHRVQRVPLTEKSGRVHTSAASVAVLPQADEVFSRLMCNCGMRT